MSLEGIEQFRPVHPDCQGHEDRDGVLIEFYDDEDVDDPVGLIQRIINKIVWSKDE